MGRRVVHRRRRVFSPAIFAAGWISVYNETELWAFTLALVSVTLVVEWAAIGFTSTRPLVGAIGRRTRGDVDQGPDRARRGLRDRRVRAGARLAQPTRSRPDANPAGVVAVVGGLLPLVAHAAVNWAKFGTLFSVPGGRQLLSLQDPSRAAWFAGNNDSFFSSRGS